MQRPAAAPLGRAARARRGAISLLLLAVSFWAGHAFVRARGAAADAWRTAAGGGGGGGGGLPAPHVDDQAAARAWDEAGRRQFDRLQGEPGGAARPPPPLAAATAASGVPPPASPPDAISDAISRFRGAPLAFVTFGNAAYEAFFLNWWRSVAALPDSPPALVLAFDASTAALCRRLGVAYAVDLLGGGDFRGANSTFRAMGSLKARFVLRLLQEGGAQTVVVSDTDVAWLRDPRPYLDAYPQARPLSPHPPSLPARRAARCAAALAVRAYCPPAPGALCRRRR